VDPVDEKMPYPDLRARGGGCGAGVAALIALLLAGLGWLYANEDLFAPNSLPWKPVVLDAPPRWLAHWQMDNLKSNRQACRTALAGASALVFVPLADRRIDDRCGFENVVRTEDSPVTFAPKVTATCVLTAALYWYQRQLQPIAEKTMHASITGVSQLGTFSCRNVNGEAAGNRSQHATANAIDVAAFRFADGRSATVVRDYGKPTPEGRFLDAAHDQACRLFGVVLGPRYNRLHANHFHLDMGGVSPVGGLCS
jgi:hypothetical protein